jgi:hypothetical protein
MEMGEGSPIWTSIGDSTTVFDRQNGVRASRFGGFLVCEVGDSRETWLRSMLDGASDSSVMLLEEREP